MEAGVWYPSGVHQFVDRRSQLRRGGLVRVNVRAYRGLIVRKGDNGRPEYDRCPHAHSKPKAARTCAEREARRRNRQEARA